MWTVRPFGRDLRILTHPSGRVNTQTAGEQSLSLGVPPDFTQHGRSAITITESRRHTRATQAITAGLSPSARRETPPLIH